jgi:hypothetical protein
MPELAGSERRPALALLAGGLATRLRPTTITTPKSMIEIADEPFVAHQLRLLSDQGISEIVICAGYLGEQIEAYVGDGGTFGCNVRYSFDGDRLLGTGGALRKALPLLGDRFFVMYGDSYLPTPFAPIQQAFERAGLPALMTVFRNAGRWDTSNVEFIDGVIRGYDKVDRTPAMLHIGRRTALSTWLISIETWCAAVFSPASKFTSASTKSGHPPGSAKPICFFGSNRAEEGHDHHPHPAAHFDRRGRH